MWEINHFGPTPQKTRPRHVRKSDLNFVLPPVHRGAAQHMGCSSECGLRAIDQRVSIARHARGRRNTEQHSMEFFGISREEQRGDLRALEGANRISFFACVLRRAHRDLRREPGRPLPGPIREPAAAERACRRRAWGRFVLEQRRYARRADRR